MKIESCKKTKLILKILKTIFMNKYHALLLTLKLRNQIICNLKISCLLIVPI